MCKASRLMYICLAVMFYCMKQTQRTWLFWTWYLDKGWKVDLAHPIFWSYRSISWLQPEMKIVLSLFYLDRVISLSLDCSLAKMSASASVTDFKLYDIQSASMISGCFDFSSFCYNMFAASFPNTRSELDWNTSLSLMALNAEPPLLLSCSDMCPRKLFPALPYYP